MMRIVFCLMLCIFLSSCNFDKTIPDKDELLTERLQEINWNEITRFPSLATCDSISDKNAHQICFFEHFYELIKQRLLTDTLSVLYPQIDTINLKITINTDRSLVFETQFDKQKNQNLEEIDSIIQVRLRNFPPIEPAQKDGILVKTEFLFPVIVKARE